MPWQQRRLDVTPGLTCIWQVSGRSNVSFADWVRMDLQYTSDRTLRKDLQLLAATVPAVLARRGAY
jgi:lipopolysaccharide/colanic/teichoic acid biosynthesis glycosyltransferase